MVNFVKKSTGIQTILKNRLYNGDVTRPWRSLMKMLNSIILNEGEESDLLRILREENREELYISIDFTLIKKTIFISEFIFIFI